MAGTPDNPQNVKKMTHYRLFLSALATKLLMEIYKGKKKERAPRAQTSRLGSFGLVLLTAAAISLPALVIICLSL